MLASRNRAGHSGIKDPPMDFMNLAAALIYWVIVAIWTATLCTIAVLYSRNPPVFGTTRLLLAVLALDTLRNLFENSYFGLFFGSRYGLLPAKFAVILGDPLLLIVPKLTNIAAGCIVLGVLLLRWLPTAVRERVKSEQDARYLRELAEIDGLTGLFNRRHFLDLANREWERCRRYNRPLSLIMIDIDLFKDINDRFGHDVGDRVIVQVANACHGRKRGSDAVARMGGEEFTMLLPETGLQDACIVAERIRQAVSEIVLEPRDRRIKISISAGVSAAGDANGLADLIKHADLALYEAKSAGRNRVRNFKGNAQDPLSPLDGPAARARDPISA
jgi:diguanylate cyclase (GGDEF)-like protein